jgi:hypothetical protein
LFGNRRLERFEARQEAVLEQIGHITAALIVREPGTALSANAYDGLRKQVSIAARDRRQHLARLIELVEAIDNGATTETLRRKCEQWCQEVGLEAVTGLDRAEPDWFRIVEGDGPEVEVLTPAWADTEVGHLVQRGTARRSWPEPEPEPAPAPDADEPDTAAVPPTDAETPETPGTAGTAGTAEALAAASPDGETADAGATESPAEAETAETTGATATTDAATLDVEPADADADAAADDDVEPGAEPDATDGTEKTEPAATTEEAP